MLCGDGTVKLLDFGIAKARGASSKTRTGTVKGKNAYMSPEQILGKPLDRRSDIFALGAVMYEMLAIKRLFHRDSDFMTFKAITEEPIPDIRDRRPDLPALLRAAVIQALARDPAARFATAKDFAEALRNAVAPMGGPASAADLARLLSQDFGDEMAARDEILKAADEPHDPATAIPVGAPNLATGPVLKVPPPGPRPPPIPQAAAGGELSSRSRRPSAPLPDSGVPSMIVHPPSSKISLPAELRPAVAPGLGMVPLAMAPTAPVMVPTAAALAAGVVPGLAPPPEFAVELAEPSTDLLKTYRRRSMIRALLGLAVGAALIAGLVVVISMGGGADKRDKKDPAAGAAPPVDAAIHGVLVEDDEGPTPRENIEAISKYGFFSLSATAKTAVYIDGKPYGDLPITRMPLTPGNYKVHAVGPKGKSKDLKVMIIGGKDSDEGVITW
jgi:serine/threonine-protein kinase